MGGAEGTAAPQLRGPEVVALGASDFVVLFLLVLVVIIVLPRYLRRAFAQLQRLQRRHRAGAA